MKYEVKEFDTRYFAGIEHPGGLNLNFEQIDLQNTWHSLMNIHPEKIQNKSEPNLFVGLECYPPDFAEEEIFDYYALVQTKELIKESEGISTKKLPKGKYIQFEIQFSDIKNEIQKVYKYINENKIKINRGFDFEQYIDGEDYSKDGSKLLFCFLLLEDD